MRIGCFDDFRVGVVRGDRIWDVSELLGSEDEWPHTRMLRLISRFDSYVPAINRLLQRDGIPVTSVAMRCPIPQPPKIILAGLNYPTAEPQPRPRDWPETGPEVLLKAASAVSGPEDDIVLPATGGESHVVQEAELAVIIGSVASHLRPSEAMNAVFGYSCCLDLTLTGARGPRSRLKSYDTFLPLGPVLVSADEVADPHSLKLQCWVNGTLRQDANTGQMISSIAELVSYASTIMTLYPGDIIATGTPDGIGALAPGDEVTVEISEIGRMTLYVRGVSD